mgnify:CR=1 FL=1|jgi:hypothetical protein
MKKIISLIFLLFFYKTLSAPLTSSENYVNLINNILIYYNKTIYEKQLDMFINYLGYRESGNNWKIVNNANCLGEWQFSELTLRYLGYKHITAEKFKSDSSIFPRKLQLEILKTYMEINEISLKPYEIYIGSEINGILITKSGLLAGAHLGGVGSVKLFIESNGNIDKEDSNGSKISTYLKEFSIYNLSGTYYHNFLEYNKDNDKLYQ